MATAGSAPAEIWSGDARVRDKDLVSSPLLHFLHGQEPTIFRMCPAWLLVWQLTNNTVRPRNKLLLCLLHEELIILLRLLPVEQLHHLLFLRIMLLRVSYFILIT